VFSDLLLEAVRDPAATAGWSAADWDLLLRQARKAALDARLAVQITELGLADAVPEPVRKHVRAAVAVAKAHDRSVRWEIDRIAHALAPLSTRVVLLKGAAYLASGLAVAKGRLTADTDILVAKADLERVEKALLDRGWEHGKLDEYDQQYYRRWMHELPPLWHPERGSVIDVHHTILPESSRLKPDPAALLADARPLPDVTGICVLAPCDMVLHSAAHLFYDGSFARDLRDLVDLDDLLRHFGAEAGFWDHLARRAERLDLARPFFYLTHFAPKMLSTPIPPATIDAARAGSPGRLAFRLMDRLVTDALRPEHPDRPGRLVALERWLLYVRSHWLRMPPLLLFRHLATKGFKRAFKKG